MEEIRGDEREGYGRKREMTESEGTEKITSFLFYPYLLQGQQALPNCKPVSVGCPGDKTTGHLRLTQPTPLVCHKKHM